MGCIGCGCKLKQVPRGRNKLLCKECREERDKLRKRENYRIDATRKKKGCGGSSTWEKPSNYKNPEIDAVTLFEKKVN